MLISLCSLHYITLLYITLHSSCGDALFTKIPLGLLWVGHCFSDRGCDLPWSKDAGFKSENHKLLLTFFVKWSSTSVEGVNDKEGCLFFPAWEGTGPVNLALWRVTMTRGFTGHKPRGMRECRKWATVSIFCQTALRLLLPLHSLCVYACNCYPLLQFKFPIEVMLLVSEALSSSLTFTLARISCRWFWPAQIETPPQRLTALFLGIVWNCRIKRRPRRQHLETHARTCTISWGITKATERNGSFIMIAAGISGHNYQRWLIHSLIASFNLFTFGAEQCQPAADESNLLQGRGTCMSHRHLHVSIFVMIRSSGHLAKPRSLIMQFNNWKMGVWFCCLRGKWQRNRWESKLEGVKNQPLH